MVDAQIEWVFLFNLLPESQIHMIVARGKVP